MSDKTSYSKQTVELALKGRSTGSNYLTLTRTVRIDDQGAFILYRGSRVSVLKHHQNDGIDWLGTVQR